MNTTAKLLFGTLAALTLGGGAMAHELPVKTSEVKVIYEGVDDQGRTVRVTIANDQAKSVSVASHVQQYPQLHWSAFIGSGTAASAQH